MTSNPRVDQALAEAQRLINENAPGLMTTSALADQIGTLVDVSSVTAKKYLRAAVDAGQLLELKPYNRGFWVTLPDEGALNFRVVVESHHPRKLILVEGEKTAYSAPSSYGPGKTTYMTTPEQAKLVVDTAKQRREAEKQAEREKLDAEKKAERAEIERREPGLLTEIRRLRFALTPDWTDAGNRISVAAHLFDRPLKRGEPYEDRSLSIHINANGTQASVLREILNTGLRHYLDNLDPKECVHCGMLILPIREKDGVHWWHILSARDKCKGADAVAAPKEES